MEITGTVTRDAVVKTTKSGKELVSFTIAVGEGYRAKSGEWVDQTQFVQCAYWRSTAVTKILGKGATVQLWGSMSAQAWQDKEGNIKAGLQFRTANIKPIRRPDSRHTAAQQPKNEGAAQPESDKDDLPF